MSIKGDVAEGAGVGCGAPKGIQETIAGFLNDQVLDPGGECYFNPQEQMKPNNDDHLYDA